MKLPRSTLILIFSALLLGGIVYVYEIEGKPQREVAKTQENKLFSFEEKDVQSVTVKTKEQTLLFERNTQQSSDKSIQPKWLMTVLEQAKETEKPKETQPTPTPEAQATQKPQNSSSTKTPEAKATQKPQDSASAKTPEAKPSEPPKETNLTKIPANEAYVSYLLDQLVMGKGDRIPSDPRVDFGLNQPQATIEVKLNNGKIHNVILGKSNFNKTSVYALVDPPNQGNQPPQVLVVSTNFENAVNRPLSEWKQPIQKK